MLTAIVTHTFIDQVVTTGFVSKRILNHHYSCVITCDVFKAGDKCVSYLSLIKTRHCC